MKKKTTLQDMRDILVNSSEGSDRHIWGVVTRKNTNSQGKVTSYEVALGGDEGSMTCRKLAGADVGDTVMVTLTKKGAAIVTGTVDGDKDAENALTAATEAQQTAEAIEDLVGDGDESGIVITTQYYLSTSNTEPTGGTWQDTMPAYVAGRYYWTKTVTTYADGLEVESDPILDIASQMTAETNAVATATDQHFWHDSTGAYITNSNKDLNSGYAMKATNAGLLQTYNGNNLMSLTSSGLTLYQSNGSTPLASYSSGGAYLYAGGNVVGSFTTSGVTIGETSSGEANIYIHTSNGNTLYEFRNGTSVLGQIMGVYSGYFQFYSGGGFQFYVDNNSNGISISPSKIYFTLDADVSDLSASHISASSIFSYGTIESIKYGNDAIIADNGSIKNMWAVNNASSYTNNVHIGSAGRFFMVSGSSKRWKNSIDDIHDEALDPHRLYDIEVKQFKFNTDYIKDENDQRYDTLVPGFIAEQIQEHYPVAVDVDMKTGEAMDWNMKFIIPPMLALIQELNERVKSLERRS